MEKIYNDKGQVQCPVCGQFVDQEDLWTENGVTACDDCVANGKAPSDFYGVKKVKYPIKKYDKNGNEIYRENSDGSWEKKEYDEDKLVLVITGQFFNRRS